MTEGLDPRLVPYVDARRSRGRPERCVALSGDASTRRYFRLTWPDRSTTIIALYPEPFRVEESSFFAVGEVLLQLGLPVPRIVDHDGALGVVEQQDLGDRTLYEALAGATPDAKREWYRDAIDELVTAQREAVRAPHRAVCFHTAFDIEKLSWELHYFEKHFLEGHRGADLSVEDRARLGESFHGLAAQIASWPRVLCHRDYHSRNLMLHEGRLFWIDYQDARMGPSTYDLASLLRDSYVDLDEGFVDERSEEFRQKAASDESREAFRRRFELTCVQRNLKALGTFGYMATVRKNPFYLPYVPRTLAHVRRNLARHPDLASLAGVLRKHIPELD